MHGRTLMKKPTKKKLKLVRQTVRTLTAPELVRVDGAGGTCAKCTKTAMIESGVVIAKIR
jgi:bacterioferritin-associated ferredoxin